MEEDEFLQLISEQFPQVLGGASEGVNQVFRKPGLTAEEEDRLSRLNQRAARLQPIEIGGGQRSTAIAGNPYSHDISPLIQGGQSVVENIFNAVRAKRRAGDPEKVDQIGTQLKDASQRLQKLKQNKQMGLVDVDHDQQIKQAEQEVARLTGELESAQGVDQPRMELLEKKDEAERSQRTVDEVIANIAPRISDNLMRRGENEADRQATHDLTMEEIQARHDATMEEIFARNNGGRSSKELPAAVLTTLSNTVGDMQDVVRTEIEGLDTKLKRLDRAEEDEYLRGQVQSQLGDQTIQQRREELQKQIDAKRQQLNTSVSEMINVAAARNNLDRATTARLLGYEPEELGIEAGGGTGTAQTFNQADLQKYMEDYPDDFASPEEARAYLESQGLTFEGE